MKRAINYTVVLLSGIVLLCSCYGLKEESYKDLAPITISGVQDTIYTKLTQTLNLSNLKIDGENDQTSYEWVYGAIAGDFPKMRDTTLISTKRSLDYAFTRTGSYVLKLKVDNGESIVLKNFYLRVQAEFDEGYLILCNDKEQNGKLAFVKKRTSQEIADGAQEVWDDLLSLNTQYQFKSMKDLFVFSSPDISGVLLCSEDADGSIYRLNANTFEAAYRMKLAEEYGTTPKMILGEKTTRGHYCYIMGNDSKAYRYEFGADILAYRETPYSVDNGVQCYYASNTEGTRVPLMYSDKGVTGFPASNIKGFAIADDYEVVNAIGTRVGVESYLIVTRSKTENQKIRIIKSNSGITSQSTASEYTAKGRVLLDRNSTMIVTKYNSNAYYNFEDKIYHWDILAVNPTIPSDDATPDITLPAGEQIMSMCTNALPSTTSAIIDDDLLLIATYNSSVTDRKPGSLFVYDLRTMTQVKAHIGICEKPVRVVYKFPTSN